MRFVDEYRCPQLAETLADEIRALCPPGRHYRVMEVCGGHTHAIYRYGVQDYLPEGIELVHGPGCPVCVIPTGRVDDGIAIAEHDEVILTCFGDMMRIPGSHGSFLQARARGADIRMVYSPLDALRLARQNPERQVVFYAIGFETTAPATALTVKQAAAEQLENFSVFSNHVTLIPALKALLHSPQQRLDAILAPGHVSTVIGCRPYEWVARDFGKPLVCSGFEPLDLLQSILMVMKQLACGVAKVENQYTRAVAYEGNPSALQVMADVFQVRPSFEWRGLGSIAESALTLSPKYARFDAELSYKVPGVKVADPRACQCGEVLIGLRKPWECKVFGTACTPDSPIGTCMVSSEGACAAYYNYGPYAGRTPATKAAS